MSTRTRDNTLPTLNLPDPFEDLTGLIGSDLKVIATALAERAGDRLLLSPRQTSPSAAQALEQTDPGDQRDDGIAHRRAAMTFGAPSSTMTIFRRLELRTMARVLLGVTGSVAAIRTPAFSARFARPATRFASWRRGRRSTFSIPPSSAGPTAIRPRSRPTGRSFATATNGPEPATTAAMKSCTSSFANGRTS